MEINLQKIAQDTIEEAVKQATKNIIAREIGSGIDGEMKDAIKAHAKAMMETPEMQEKLKNALCHWMKY